MVTFAGCNLTKKTLRYRLIKSFLFGIAFLLLMLISLVFAINTEFVSSKVIAKVQDYFNTEYNKQLEVGKYHLALDGDIELYDVFLEDSFGDTLASFSSLNLNLGYLALLDKKVLIEDLSLVGANSKIVFIDSMSNFDYFINEAVPVAGEVQQPSLWSIDIGSVTLRNTRFFYKNIIGNQVDSLTTQVEYLYLRNDSRNLLEMISLNELKLKNGIVSMSFNTVAEKDTITSNPSNIPLIQLNNATLENIDVKGNIGEYLNFSHKEALFSLSNSSLDVNNSNLTIGEIKFDNFDSDIVLKQSNSESIDSTVLKDEVSNWKISISSCNVSESNVLAQMGEAYLLQKINFELRDFTYDQIGFIEGKLESCNVVFQDSIKLKESSCDFTLDKDGSKISSLNAKVNDFELKSDLTTAYSVFSKSETNGNLDIERFYVPYSALSDYINIPKEYTFLFDREYLEISALLELKDSILHVSDFKSHLLDLCELKLASLNLLLQSENLEFDVERLQFKSSSDKIAKILKEYGVENEEIELELISLNYRNNTVEFNQAKLVSDFGEALMDGEYSVYDTSYKLSFDIKHFDLQNAFGLEDTFLINNALFDLDGQSFNPGQLKAKLVSNIGDIHYRDTVISNLSTKIHYKKMGDVDFELRSVHDKDTLFFTSQTALSLEDSTIKSNFLMEIPKLNFRDLRLIDTADFISDFKMEGELDFISVDKWSTSGVLETANTSINGVRILDEPHARWNVSSDTLQSIVKLNALSMDVEASIKGPISVFFENYASVLNSRKDTSSLVDHKIVIKSERLNVLREVINLLSPESNFYVEGIYLESVKNQKSTLNLIFSLAEVEFKGVELIDLNGNLHFDTLSVNSFFDLDSMKYKQLAIENIDINIFTSDSLKKIEFSLFDNDGLKHLNFGAKLLFQEEGVVFNLNDSILLNYEDYYFKEDNYIKLNKNGEVHSNFNLSTNESIISVDATIKEDGTSDLEANIGHLKLNYLFEVLNIDSTSAELNANLTGVFDGEKLQSKIDIEFDSIKYRSMAADFISIKGNLENSKSQFSFNILGNLNNVGLLNSKGEIDYVNQSLDAELKLKDVSLAPITAFTDGLSSNKGFVNLDAKIWGDFINPNYKGELEIVDANIYSDFLNNTFELDKVVLDLDNRGLYFNHVQIRDQENGKFRLNGLILNNNNDLFYDLKIDCDKFVAFNTTAENNKYFHGKLISTMLLNVTGPLMIPNVQGSIHLLKGSHFIAMEKEDLESRQEQNIVEFISENDSLSIDLRNLDTGLKLGNAQIIVTIDDKTNFKYILNEETNEYLEFTAGGKLDYYSKLDGQESLIGKFGLNKGKVIIKPPIVLYREFSIDPTSSIIWDGEKDNPLIDVKAIYTIRASTEGLIDGVAKRVEPFDVYIVIDGRLDSRSIWFDVRSTREDVQLALNKLSPEERNTQALSLLIFGTLDMGADNSSKNTQLNSIISSQVSSVASNKIKGVEVEVDLETYEQQGTSGTVDKTDFNYKFKKDLGDQFSMQVGGKVSSHQEANSSSALLGDIIVEYYFNKKRNTSAKVFTENSYEGVLDGDITKAGLGVSARKKFLRSKDVRFKKKKRNKYEIKKVE